MGKFTLKGLFVGAYTLEMSAKGYQTQTLSHVSAGKQQLKIVLPKKGQAIGVTQNEQDANPPVVYQCDVTDRASKKPIPNARVVWQVRHKTTREKLWRTEHVTNANGQYEVRMPNVVAEQMGRIVEVETSHRDYLPKRGGGYLATLSEKADPKMSEGLIHLKLELGKEVTGRFVMPDGSPAKGVTVMIGDNRDGLQDGLGIGFYTTTDAQGKFRLLTLPRWPQRISWFPENHATNSKAITKNFGEQETIRLKPGLTLKGKLVDYQGKPMPNVYLRASTGTRIPRLYAKSNENGEFAFAPMRDKLFTLGGAFLSEPSQPRRMGSGESARTNSRPLPRSETQREARIGSWSRNRSHPGESHG